MDPTRHDLAGGVFLKARDLVGGEREAYLARSCGSDEELRGEVESLLAADSQETSPLFRHDTPVAAGPGLDSAPRPGERIGQHVVQRVIGSGGMGTVYEAMQDRPRRRVALKTMRPGLMAQSALRRFEYESQVLALLRHPGIAQVYEAGIHHTQGGEVPYFVMEFVSDARPVNEYACQEQLSLRQCLELFVTTCEAAEHAHRNGVIHRDLKPENVLVDRAGQSKIIDFGIARLVQSDGERITRHTTMGEVLGTLPYLSPEQAAGDPSRVDTRTDVYALGVILYEVLTGKLPYSVEGGLAEAVRHILREEPTPPRTHNSFIDGEVETILLKCLQKERDRRYQSAGELGRDIQRYLRGEAIEAKRDSGWYMLRKTVRRYRVQAIAAATLVLFAAVSAIALSFMYSAQKRERLRADQAATTAVEERQRAVESADIAKRNAAEARWRSYVADLAAASHAESVYDAGQAKKHLEAAPAEYRNWEWHHLMKSADFSYLTLAPPGEAAISITFSPDSKAILVGYNVGTLRAWDAASGAVLLEYPSGSSQIDLLTFDSSGTRLLVAEKNGTVRVLDALSGEELLRRVVPLSGEYAGIKALSTDGLRAVICAKTGEAPQTQGVYESSVYDLGSERAIYLLGEQAVAGCAFSPDGLRIATGDTAGAVAIRRWDRETPEFAADIEPPSRTYAVAFEGTGKMFATSHDDGTIRLWEPAGRGLVRTITNHSQRVWAMAFSFDGGILASASQDKTVRLSDVSTGRVLSVLAGHENGVPRLAYSPDGSRLASLEYRTGVAKLWKTRASSPVLQLSAPTLINSLAFDRNGRRVLTASDDGELTIWDAETGESLHRFDCDVRQSRAAMFSPEPNQIIAAYWGGRIEFLDISTGQTTRTLQGPIVWPRTMALSPDGRYLAVGGAADLMKVTAQMLVWDLATGEPTSFIGHDARMFTVAFSPDGSLLASAAEDGTARLWEPSTGKCILTYAGHQPAGSVMGLAFSPDGATIATTGVEGTIRIWNPATGETIRTITGNMLDVWSVAFSPDGKRLVTGARDATVRLWDAVTGDELLVLRGPTGTVRRVAFSPDGNRVAAGTHNKEVFIWNAAPVPSANASTR